MGWRSKREQPWDGKRSVIEPADPDWWKRPYAGRDPPEGAKQGRPWFALRSDGQVTAWVDEHGWRWPVSTLPGSISAPEQPTGSEPLEAFTRLLRELELKYDQTYESDDE